MGGILFKNLTVATCDEQDTVQEGVNVLIDRGRIVSIGPRLDISGELASPEQEIDGTGCIAVPGLINGHHHLYQTLTRGLRAVQDVPLFDWLVGQYPIWANLSGDMVYTSALVGLAELALSGATTVSDMFYVFPRDSDVRLDRVIQAAQDLGVRVHAGRGSMSRGKSKGGLPPDEVVQEPDEILADTERLVKDYHDPEPFAMTRVDVMPCSPFSVTPELMRDSLAFARSAGLLCQTHLAETLDEERFCLETVGMRPLAYMEQLGWLGPDVSFAHGIHLDANEVALCGQTGTSVVHCPSSNLRLSSGIAPVADLLAAGAPVGLGVDGSSSNDGGSLLAEARMAMLVGRLKSGPGYSARQALGLATREGARLLRRPELGTLAPGMAADLAIFDLDRVEYAGAAAHDPLGALLLCQPTAPRYVVCAGRIIVADGRLVTIDIERIVAHHNKLARQLVDFPVMGAGTEAGATR
ncbi:MAG: 8-oxoguanine deaminase [Candidatus Sericytochromatia bacterium]|nr:8-oxoguanine deaminase [Candidatus Tanganyikabacteria bacterium]